MGYYTWYQLEDILDRETKESVYKKAHADVLGLIKYIDSVEAEQELKGHALPSSWVQKQENLPWSRRWWEIWQLFKGPDVSMKWYEHDEDLCQWSKMFPNYIFIVTGEGEESEDIWKSAYCNGKCTHTMAEIVFPDLNLEAVT